MSGQSDRLMWFRRRPGRIVPALAAVVSMAVAACAPAAPPPTPKAEQPVAPKTATEAAKPAAKAPARRTLVISYTQDLTSLYPYSHSASTEYAQWLHIYDPLVFRDQKVNDWVPHVAESWSNPDPNTWEFKLRTGITFDDGSELTAEDVVFSFQRMTNDKESLQAGVLRHVDKMEAPDRYTVRLRTKNPDAAMLSRLDNRIITSKAYYEKLGAQAADKAPMGTGPYKLKEWVPGQRLVLTRKDTYWGPFKAAWDEVIFRPIPEDEARITALINGEVDIIANVPPQQVERLNRSGTARAEGVRGLRMIFVGLNPIVEPLQKVEVRQAIAHAIDKDAIVQGVLQGRAYRLDGPLGPSMYSYDKELQPRYDYNPTKAKELLARAGYPNGFEIDFYTPVNRYIRDKDVSTAIVQMLSQVGIKANLKTPEWATFNDEFNKGKYPMYLIGRGSVDDPSEYLHQYFRTGVTKRLGGFSDPEVDAALLAEQKEFDPKKRVELLRTAQRLIMQRSPAVFLYQYEDTYGVHKRTQFVPRPDEYIFAWDAKPSQ